MQIEAGSHQTFVLTEDGNAYAFGNNWGGVLGLGDSINRNIPTRITTLDSHKVVQISGGSQHTLGLTENGAVLAWGDGSGGRLGLGDTTSRLTPTIIPYFQEISQ